jgi:hypothetical protein
MQMQKHFNPGCHTPLSEPSEPFGLSLGRFVLSTDHEAPYYYDMSAQR